MGPAVWIALSSGERAGAFDDALLPVLGVPSIARSDRRIAHPGDLAAIIEQDVAIDVAIEIDIRPLGPHETFSVVGHVASDPVGRVGPNSVQDGGREEYLSYVSLAADTTSGRPSPSKSTNTASSRPCLRSPPSTLILVQACEISHGSSDPCPGLNAPR